MNNLFSPGDADQMLARGLISQDQHAQITGMSSAAAPMSPAPAPPPPAPMPRPTIPFDYTAPRELPVAEDNMPAPVSKSQDLGNALAVLAYNAGPAARTANEQAAMRVAHAGDQGPMLPGQGTAPMAPKAPAAPPVSVASSGTDGVPTPQRLLPEVVVEGSRAPAAPKGPGLLADNRRAQFAALQGLEDKTRDNLAAKGAAMVERDEMEATIQARALAASQAREAADAKARAEDNAIVEKRMADANNALTAYGEMKVDPKRYYKNVSTVEAIGNVIGVALMGLGGAGANNPILAKIERDIDRDINAQQADIQKAGNLANAKAGLVKDMISITGSREAGRAAAKVAALDNVRQEIITNASKYQGKIDEADVAELLNQVQKRRDTAQMNFDKQMRAEAVAGAAARRAAALAADERAFSRGEKLEELSIKKQNADTERIKAMQDKTAGPNAASTQDAAYKAELAQLRSAWDLATKTLPSSGITDAVGNFFNTDNSRQFKAANATLGSVMTGEGEKSDADYISKVVPKLPAPNDDAETLRQKYAEALQKLATKHPAAAARAQANAVATTAPPGGN